MCGLINTRIRVELRIINRLRISFMQPAPEQIFDFVKRKILENKGLLTKVARECDVPYSTLMKISQGVVANPRIGTIQKLADYFKRPVA